MGSRGLWASSGAFWEGPGTPLEACVMFTGAFEALGRPVNVLEVLGCRWKVLEGLWKLFKVLERAWASLHAGGRRIEVFEEVLGLCWKVLQHPRKPFENPEKSWKALDGRSWNAPLLELLARPLEALGRP